MFFGLPLLASLLALPQSFAYSPRLSLRSTAQDINLRRLTRGRAEFTTAHSAVPVAQSTFNVETEFPEQWFEQPVDHFNASYGTFKQRYWVSTRHYTAGGSGPVIVLDGGETSGEDRLPFLDTGIVDILARATNGVGVILEHRYYGKSIPVNDFSTDSLRFLNNDQAVADSANFMKNVKLSGIEEDLTAPGTPWIYYGGSYAGARAAHMRILHPDIVYGAIASSAVTHAAIDNWEYMDVIRRAADPLCSAHIEGSIKTIDGLLANGHTAFIIKSLFGLEKLSHNDDFASILETPLGAWQAKVWDPAVGSKVFDEFCAELRGPYMLASYPYGHSSREVELEESGSVKLDLAVFHYAKWIRKHIVSLCPKELGIEKCFGTYDDEQYTGTNLDQDWRLWQFQVCTEWGYFIPPPPNPEYPRIISNQITLEYEAKICRQAFPPGEHFKVPAWPNVTVVNELGDFAIAADRLAIIDGEVDPWRPMTPHSESSAKDREDTVLRPFKIIPDAVHHYDEYGLKDMSREPPEIRRIHGEMIFFVISWLKDWHLTHIS
ncbi:peptidase S28 [Flagelloscypha sp. PMI_526]|nr:peptidase S28 [Flagelloscypha sp. PMI_526]